MRATALGPPQKWHPPAPASPGCPRSSRAPQRRSPRRTGGRPRTRAAALPHRRRSATAPTALAGDQRATSAPEGCAPQARRQSPDAETGGNRVWEHGDGTQGQSRASIQPPAPFVPSICSAATAELPIEPAPLVTPQAPGSAPLPKARPPPTRCPAIVKGEAHRATTGAPQPATSGVAQDDSADLLDSRRDARNEGAAAGADEDGVDGLTPKSLPPGGIRVRAWPAEPPRAAAKRTPFNSLLAAAHTEGAD
eukprot:scaffold3513_cov127-Isochrysis_galbana.AAC.4